MSNDQKVNFWTRSTLSTSPNLCWTLPSLALIWSSVFTRGFRHDQKYLPRLREAFKTSNITGRKRTEVMKTQRLLDMSKTYGLQKKEMLQLLADIKGCKCPRHSWIKGWFLTTDHDTNTGRIKFSYMPNSSCRVNYLPTFSASGLHSNTSFQLPNFKLLLRSKNQQQRQKDSQYFHPTWPQKIFLEMYFQPKPNNRTPYKIHSSTSQGTGFKSAFRPQWHMGFRAATAPTWRTMLGYDVTQIEATRCIRFGGGKEGKLKIHQL